MVAFDTQRLRSRPEHGDGATVSIDWYGRFCGFGTSDCSALVLASRYGNYRKPDGVVAADPLDWDRRVALCRATRPSPNTTFAWNR